MALAPVCHGFLCFDLEVFEHAGAGSLLDHAEDLLWARVEDLGRVCKGDV